MPSFLTSERMSPELRARVLVSLKGDARSRLGGAGRFRARTLLRLLGMVGGVALLAALALTFRQSRLDFAQAKRGLINNYRSSSKPFDSAFHNRVKTLDELLRGASVPHAGDVIDEQLTQRGSTQLAELLKAPLVAIRLQTSEAATAQGRLTREGGPDALVRCLIDPPPSTKESALLRHLGHVYEPKVFRAHFADADAAYAAIKFVDSSFEEDLHNATLMREVESLKRRLNHARLNEGARFSEARLVFYVFDEPKARGEKSDFDGESDHMIRLGVVDLTTGKTWLRLRRRVNPDWISDKSRMSYSRDLDGCLLALQIHGEIQNSR